MNKGVVNGMVRLYRGSPRVREFDYDRRMYQDPDYYGAIQGDHFLRRSDFNLLPIGQDVYMTRSPYSAIPSSYGNFNPSGCGCASMGYLGEPDAPSDSNEADESGFDLVGMLVSAYEWSQSEEGKKAIKKGQELYDSARQIGQGGSSNTSVKGLKIQNKPIGTIPIEEIVRIMTRIEGRLVPSTFSTVADIPKESNPSLISAFLGQSDYPLLTRIRIQSYNIMRQELQERLSEIPADVEAGGSGGSGGSGASGKSSVPTILAVGAIGGLALFLALKLRK
tara:strand:+ start:8070 stop:8906 length:837 start_codon:yes stop_codon:yes gene_type:complete